MSSKLKNLGGKPPKSRFVNERQVVLEKLLNILGVTEDNKFVYLYDLDHDIDKQNAILGLEEDIKKYFVYGTWSYFSKPKSKRPYVSLAKSVIKDMNIEITQIIKTETRNNKRMTLRGFMVP